MNETTQTKNSTEIRAEISAIDERIKTLRADGARLSSELDDAQEAQGRAVANGDDDKAAEMGARVLKIQGDIDSLKHAFPILNSDRSELEKQFQQVGLAEAISAKDAAFESYIKALRAAELGFFQWYASEGKALIDASLEAETALNKAELRTRQFPGSPPSYRLLTESAHPHARFKSLRQVLDNYLRGEFFSSGTSHSGEPNKSIPEWFQQVSTAPIPQDKAMYKPGRPTARERRY